MMMIGVAASVQRNIDVLFWAHLLSVNDFISPQFCYEIHF